ncbi:hypothetical protein AB0H34_34290 [Saccharopolyspora shandongensis]|uniref:hypothetical protein n=1 Tax=Saccharopolyspora shandongensis TaxID=418495 RepID=UPI0033E682A3
MVTSIDVRTTLMSYMDKNPDDRPNLVQLVGLLADGIDVTTRAEIRGHVTASPDEVGGAEFCSLNVSPDDVLRERVERLMLTRN